MGGREMERLMEKNVGFWGGLEGNEMVMRWFS